MLPTLFAVITQSTQTQTTNKQTANSDEITLPANANFRRTEFANELANEFAKDEIVAGRDLGYKYHLVLFERIIFKFQWHWRQCVAQARV